MIIKNISIKEYGAIKNLSLDFDSGLNIIEGFNESGKSTVLSFIRFMLYGLPKKSQSERDRALSWENGLAKGTMTVSCKGGNFRIERGAKTDLRGESLSIIDLATGTQVFKGENPGELFFGVPLSVFESTACTGQLRCSDIDGEKLGSALENILLTANEATNTQKAISKLESVRKKLLHKNQKGGSVFKLSLERDALRARVEEAKQKSMKIMEDEAMFESLEDQCADNKKALTETKKLIDAYEKRQLIIRFDGVRSAKKRTEAIAKEKRELLEKSGMGDFVPTRAFVGELSGAERALRSANEKKEFLEKDFARAKAIADESADSEKLAVAEKIQEMGGAEYIYSSLCKKRKKSVRLLISFVASLLMSGCLTLLGTASLLTLWESFLGRFSFIKDFSYFTVSAFALAGVLLVFSVICLILRSGEVGRINEICRLLSVDRRERGENIRKIILDCVSKKEKYDRAVFEKEKAGLAFSCAEKEFKESILTASCLLEKCGEKFPETCSDYAGFVAEICDTLSKLCDKIEELDKDFEKYKAVYLEREKDLCEYDEAELRASISDEMLEKLSELNISMLRREYDFIKAKAESAEQKKYFYDRELIALRATAENPLRSQTLLSDVTKRLEDETFMYEAVKLAITSISESADNLRKSITPRLRSKAGEMMSSLTKGRYTGLGIGPDFSVTAELDGVTRPVELLSAGTRDAAYLSVRLALVSVLYRLEHPVILLDEALSQIDDTRAADLLSMLDAYCQEGVQCLLFTCHSRESKLIEANTIRLGKE